MMTPFRTSAEFSASQLSLLSSGSAPEDWDRSETEIKADGTAAASASAVSDPSASSQETAAAGMTRSPRTPRNSVAFPAHGGAPMAVSPRSAERARDGKRTLSDLLRMYAEKGTEMRCTQDEAARVGQELGQWINSGASPYEGEDDFFARARDDSMLSLRSHEPMTLDGLRPRGQSESVIVPPRSPAPMAANS